MVSIETLRQSGQWHARTSKDIRTPVLAGFYRTFFYILFLASLLLSSQSCLHYIWNSMLTFDSDRWGRHYPLLHRDLSLSWKWGAPASDSSLCSQPNRLNGSRHITFQFDHCVGAAGEGNLFPLLLACFSAQF